MRIGSATEPPAASAAYGEAEQWAAIAGQWQASAHPAIWRDLPPIEAKVIPEADPKRDLEQRAGRWQYPLGRCDLSDLSRFAAALAQTEAEAWERGNPSLATQAYADRRFLAGDRIVPWAVPWLHAVARCFPDHRKQAEQASEQILELGERHRLAPQLAGQEGLVPPGYDGYGPAADPQDLGRRLRTLWGGMVVFARSLRSVTGVEQPDLEHWLRTEGGLAATAAWYDVAAARWRTLAERFPGTRQYWFDLAERANYTVRVAERLL